MDRLDLTNRGRRQVVGLDFSLSKTALHTVTPAFEIFRPQLSRPVPRMWVLCREGALHQYNTSYSMALPVSPLRPRPRQRLELLLLIPTLLHCLRHLSTLSS
jgi:hypothetical protein